MPAEPDEWITVRMNGPVEPHKPRLHVCGETGRVIRGAPCMNHPSAVTTFIGYEVDYKPPGVP